MENVFNRKNYKFLGSSDLRKSIKYTKLPTFKKEFFITKNLTIIELEKPNIVFDKPIYVGFSILEHSKLHMYKLHYNHFKTILRENAILMYMDTDSLIYEISNVNIYEHMKLFPNIFDVNQEGTLGLLKDEYPEGISEFVCLKSKCYALIKSSKRDTKKCKGVKTSEVNKLTFADYLNTLHNMTTYNVLQKTFRSYNHQIFTLQLNKTALTHIDDKRLLTNNIYLTVPHGYFKLNNYD